MRLRTANIPRIAVPRGLSREEGSLIVIVMVFVMVFLILGVALYWLVTGQTRATETERTDIKAFNVAEAGVDAGMLALKLDWPEDSGDSVTVDTALLKSTLQAENPSLWNPKRSDPSQFLRVATYDNVDGTGATSTVAYPDAPLWDSNGDGCMFVDSSANVGDDRHRILILAERQTWVLDFPTSLALWAGAVDSNGQGLEITIEPTLPVTPPSAEYDVHDVLGKGIDEGPGVSPSAPTEFDQIVTESVRKALEGIAENQGTYFSGTSADDDASAFLASGEADGKVVYVKADGPVTLAGDTQIGTEEDPVVVVIDTPDGSENTWDMKGTADFYGILITIGDSVLRGTCGVHGAMYCSGTLANKGNGSSGEINYNINCIRNVNGQYVISVNIVPNTWEEFTVPTTATTAGP